ncbi:MAG: FAD binding domain-containing protein [Puniceicoccaceae bacterium]
MVGYLDKISFVLNDRRVDLERSPGLTVLDCLRTGFSLTGTKEGCKEGDCGACTVILGTLKEGGGISYEPMTSCLLAVDEIHGKHLVTVEGLLIDGDLSPVQRAMVDCGGTQCGYCTPGFVVAMTAGMMDPKLPLNRDGLLYAISGNLCRCTGYRSIKEAGTSVLRGLQKKISGGDRIEELCRESYLPAYFLKVPELLSEISDQFGPTDPSGSEEFYLAGGTDLFVQRGEHLMDSSLYLLSSRGTKPVPEVKDGWIRMDARITFEEFVDDPLIQQQLGGLADWNLLISSWPVRTRATLGGNICNGSPIADMTCLLLALGAELTLSDRGRIRTVPLGNFYLGYKQLNKRKEEILTEIAFPAVGPDDLVNWEKVSKRRWLDIATVNSAIRLKMDGTRVVSARLALGGVAATPLVVDGVGELLDGSELGPKAVAGLLHLVEEKIAPISDVRGSASYKRLLARQLVLAHFAELFPETFSSKEIYAAL